MGFGTSRAGKGADNMHIYLLIQGLCFAADQTATTWLKLMLTVYGGQISYLNSVVMPDNPEESSDEEGSMDENDEENDTGMDDASQE